ncbi:MAG: peptidoglycan DD-metalloendopeptidase family protein [Rhodobacteraceae bacterium]|nr:peptidoglycan DD-metalloendopeptidase family protein [Paracoccaceae bacterium]
MNTRALSRLAMALERHLPELRLLLKSGEGTRFVWIRPGTQVLIILGSAAFVGWTVVVTSIFMIDIIRAGSTGHQVAQAQMACQRHLNALSEERDAYAAESRQAQERFAIAMDQVSGMQSRLLDLEERRQALETTVGVVRSALHRTMTERDEARDRADLRPAGRKAGTGMIQPADGPPRNMEQILAFLAAALEDTAGERDEARINMAEAYARVDRLEFEAELAAERNERIFTRIEEAIAMSLGSLDTMFRRAGLPTDQIIEQMRRESSVQGGPFVAITMSSRGEDPDPLTLRTNEVLEGLDQVNLHRMAAEQLPFARPVLSSFRLTSGFGPRRDPISGGWRMHAGADFAGPVGTPIYATGDGVVTFARRSWGYGLMVEIQHSFGIETRYAHMSRIHVHEGQRVSRGDRIGDMGRTGRATGSHLHYEVHQNGTTINPMNFIMAGRDVF